MTRTDDPKETTMLKRGDRVRFREGAFSWANEAGDTGTYEGGADYVPGLDAGCFTVKLDRPNRFGHVAVPHWTHDEVEASWERVADDEREDVDPSWFARGQHPVPDLDLDPNG